ncbi:MAG: MFS transporter [Sulfuricurvum sp.]|nr:MFS transporter [Sulfuricurvum sp.]
MSSINTGVKITLLAVAMLTVMSNAAIITSLPHLGEHFKTINTIELLSRLMITLPSIAVAVLAPFLGHIIHKTSLIKSALAGLILFSVSGSAGLYLSDIYTLLASRMVLGIAIAILMIVGTSLVGDYFQGAARHKFMGLQSAFISIGGILFIGGGGILSDYHWRYPFGIYLIGLLILPLVFMFLNEPKNRLHDEDTGQISTPLYRVYLLAFLMMVIFYTLPTQMPFLIMNHFGASGTLTGFIISSAMASNALGALSFAKFKQRYGFPTIYLIGLISLSIGFIAIGNIDNVYLFFITSPIMGFSGGLLMTTTTAWMLHKAHHTKRIKASGYLTSALYAGQFCSPILFHPFVKLLGLSTFFIMLGGLILMSAISILLFRSTSGSSQEP